ncbi:MAG: murein DD-endopeptidase MepM/ murein hydrolase activator NlpD [Rickettsiales bacterium]
MKKNSFFKKDKSNFFKKDKTARKNVAISIIGFIDKLIEHSLFKTFSISIITSFILFNGFTYLEYRLKENRPSQEIGVDKSPIKIKISDDYSGFKLSQTQIVQRKIKAGDTLLKILLDLGAPESDIFTILNQMKKVHDPRRIDAGQIFDIKYQVQISYSGRDNKSGEKVVRQNSDRKVFINEVSFSPSPEIDIQIVGTKDSKGNSYKAKKIIKKLTKKIVKYEATISDGLYVNGVEVGISPKIMINMINLYSFDVDFQRDIRKGDSFEILFESFYDEDGNKVKDGEILFASLDVKRIRTIGMYLDRSNKRGEYYDSKGRSVRKSLLRTPINGARISSGYGRRRHPVLGYTKMHKGIDFAAPRGTPIFAAGAGKITHYGRRGSYGNYVRIRHNSEYSSAYAHASRFARGLRVGSRVKQGQIIAYVGTTGRSTGPHLHYEILSKGKQVNPSRVKTTSGKSLKGKYLKKFKISKSEIDKLLKNTSNDNKL